MTFPMILCTVQVKALTVYLMPVQYGVVSVVSVANGPRGSTGLLLKKGTGASTVCLQYPVGTFFRRVRTAFMINLLSEMNGNSM